jgi:hypothetical protein
MFLVHACSEAVYQAIFWLLLRRLAQIDHAVTSNGIRGATFPNEYEIMSQAAVATRKGAISRLSEARQKKWVV